MVHFGKLVAIVALTTGTLIAQATSDDSAKIRSLEKTYTAVKNAFKRGDVGALEKMMASDFEHYSPQGTKMNKAQYVAGFKEWMKTTRFVKASMQNDTYDFMGNEARVRSHSEFETKVKNGKKWDTMTYVCESVDTWRSNGKGGWVILKIEDVYEEFR